MDISHLSGRHADNAIILVVFFSDEGDESSGRTGYIG
jgi:hypothetical protein